MSEMISIKGMRQEVTEFVKQLESLAPDELTTTYRAADEDPLSRKPFGQFDIVQAIVTFATSASAPIITAEIQRVIKEWRDKHKNSRLEIQHSSSSEPTAEETAQGDS